MSRENVNVKAGNLKREEFQKYLARTGVTEMLTDLLISLYKKDERPDDVFDYVRKYLSNYRKDDKNFNIDSLKKELIDAKSRVKDLKKKINKLENKDSMINQPNKSNVPKSASK
ncbi:c-Myc-binding protein homolog [Phymastichus coffea]|uniref:c-Myc-binding protein homolog n=1 Tax=Phymastichus coffea TaxID=108790 RepID=UPI00273A8EBC|nr:c-Myc-binding protein homolog [Phymastichus coffea]